MLNFVSFLFLHISITVQLHILKNNKYKFLRFSTTKLKIMILEKYSLKN